jgi:hypothetical protein
MSKKRREELVLPPVPTVATMTTSTTDQVTLALAPAPLSEYPGRYDARYLHESATPEMLDELVLAIRHKRSEAEGSERLSITASGIVWKRFRGK